MNSPEVERLIPQRAPIRMGDRLQEVDDTMAVTAFVVKAGNYFATREGTMAEPGLIEHIAQSASALAGYLALKTGKQEAPVGYIGEIKNFHCYRCPRIGEELQTTVTLDNEVDDITLITGEVRTSGELLAVTRMKIFISQEH